MKLPNSSQDTQCMMNLPSLKLTAKAPARKPSPKGKVRLPIIHFQVRADSFRKGIAFTTTTKLQTKKSPAPLSPCFASKEFLEFI